MIKAFIKDELISIIESLGIETPEFIICGGDFNTCMESIDKKGGNPNLKQHAIHEIKNLKNRFNLVDIVRIKHQQEQIFTWEMLKPTLIQERIDYFFISNSLQDHIAKCSIVPKTYSDHALPFIHIKGNFVKTFFIVGYT